MVQLIDTKPSWLLKAFIRFLTWTSLAPSTSLLNLQLFVCSALLKSLMDGQFVILMFTTLFLIGILSNEYICSNLINTLMRPSQSMFVSFKILIWTQTSTSWIVQSLLDFLLADVFVASKMDFFTFCTWSRDLVCIYACVHWWYFTYEHWCKSY